MMRYYVASFVVVCSSSACYWDRTRPVNLAENGQARATESSADGAADGAFHNADGAAVPSASDGSSAVEGARDAALEAAEDAYAADASTGGCSVAECGSKICDVGSGRCVECMGYDLSACAVDDEGKRDVCNADTSTCEVGVKEGSAPLCGSPELKACVSDEECPGGSTCIQESSSGQILGAWYCMPIEGSALCERPFAGREIRPTRDGATATVCTLSISTCSAHTDYRNRKPCDSDQNPRSGDATRCGLPEVSDGDCVKSGKRGFVCTVPCGDTDDCPARAGRGRALCASPDHETGGTSVCTQ